MQTTQSSSLIFSQDKKEYLLAWWEVISLCLFAAGISLNLHKTSLVGVNVEESEVIEREHSFLRLQARNFAFTIFGLSLGQQGTVDWFLRSYGEKFKCKLSKWKNLLISKGRSPDFGTISSH